MVFTCEVFLAELLRWILLFFALGETESERGVVLDAERRIFGIGLAEGDVIGEVCVVDIHSRKQIWKKRRKVLKDCRENPPFSLCTCERIIGCLEVLHLNDVFSNLVQRESTGPSNCKYKATIYKHSKQNQTKQKNKKRTYQE